MNQNTSFDFGDPQVQIVWNAALTAVVEENTHADLWPGASGMCTKTNKGDSAFICSEVLNHKRGRKVVDNIVFNFKHTGVSGEEPLKGKEGKIEFGDYEYFVDVLRAGERNTTIMNEQLVPFELLDQSTAKLGWWAARRMWFSAMMHLCGYAGGTPAVPVAVPTSPLWEDNTGLEIDASKGIFNFNNTPRPPDDQHIVRAGVSTTDEAVAVAADGYFQLADIDKIIARIRTSSVPLRPCANVNGREMYVMYIGPKTELHMRSDPQFDELWKQDIAGGHMGRSPFLTGALGIYHQVIFKDTNAMPPGVHSTLDTAVDQTERSVLVGCEALKIATAGRFKFDSPWQITTGSDDDIDRWVHITTMMGMSCPAYTNPQEDSPTLRDYGKIVLTSRVDDV